MDRSDVTEEVNRSDVTEGNEAWSDVINHLTDRSHIYYITDRRSELRASCQTTVPSKEKASEMNMDSIRRTLAAFYKRDDQLIIYKGHKGEREGDKNAMMKGRGRYILLGKGIVEM